MKDNFKPKIKSEYNKIFSNKEEKKYDFPDIPRNKRRVIDSSNRNYNQRFKQL